MCSQGINLELKRPPESPLIAQPPHDRSLGQASMLHYTWAILVHNAQGEKVWSFEKRDYIAADFEKQVRPLWGGSTHVKLESWSVSIEALPIKAFMLSDVSSDVQLIQGKLRSLHKRLALQVPLLPLPPHFQEGLVLHDNGVYDAQIHNTTLQMLKQMNRAILDLPTL